MNITQGKKKVVKQCQKYLQDRKIISSFYRPEIEKLGDKTFWVRFFYETTLVFTFNVNVDSTYNIIQYYIDIN